MNGYFKEDEKSRRRLRVEEQIKRVVGEILERDVKDPRIGFVTVARVETTGDLREARVFVSVLGGEDEYSRSMEGLQSARSYIQRELGNILQLRYTPVIKFLADRTARDRGRIDQIIDRIKSEEEKHGNTSFTD